MRSFQSDFGRSRQHDSPRTIGVTAVRAGLPCMPHDRLLFLESLRRKSWIDFAALKAANIV